MRGYFSTDRGGTGELRHRFVEGCCTARSLHHWYKSPRLACQNARGKANLGWCKEMGVSAEAGTACRAPSESWGGVDGRVRGQDEVAKERH
jgi:hypothetical protein